MTERMLQNRVKKLKALEAQQKALEQECDKLKEEIKKELESRGAEELKIDVFTIRWKIITNSRFDTKLFQKEHEALYNEYMRQTPSRRFTIA